MHRLGLFLIISILCLASSVSAEELKALAPGEYEVYSKYTAIHFWEAASPKLTAALKRQMRFGGKPPERRLLNHMRVALLKTVFFEAGPKKMARTGRKDAKGRAEFEVVFNPKTVYAVGRVKVLDGPFGGKSGWVVYARTRAYARGRLEPEPTYTLRKIKMRKSR